MAGSARAASGQERHRARFRAAQSLHTHSASRRDEICRRRRRTARGKSCSSGSKKAARTCPRTWRTTSLHPFRKQSQQFFCQRREIRRGRRTARMNHDVPSRSNLPSVQPYNLAEPAANSVAPDSAAQRLLDAPAEPAEIQAIGAKKNGELAARSSPSALIDRVEFGAAQQSAGTGEIETRRIRPA